LIVFLPFKCYNNIAALVACEALCVWKPCLFYSQLR